MSSTVARRSFIVLLALPLCAPLLRAAADEALKFEVFEDKANEFRWRLKQGDDIVGTAGQGYKDKSGCKRAIDSIKKGLEADKDKFEVYEDNAKAYRWRLKAANGQVVAAANKGYKDKAECEKVVDMIKKGAPKAEVVEAK
jgi:uncharacterized protein YegP (UPF0339 family)